MVRSILLALFVASNALAADQPPQQDEDGVREVVSKALIYEASGAQQGYKVYFLSLGSTWTGKGIARTDPSDEFMKRFAGRTPPVRKVSACEDKGSKVADKQTGARGIIFTVSDLKWISNTEVVVDGDVCKAGLNGYTMTYTLKRNNSQWKITDSKLQSIS